MEVKKYDKIILDSTRSIDDIVASIKAELSKQESENTGESYICYVSHAYSSGQNAGVNYIVVSDDFKRLNRLSSNVIQANAYTKDEINELIAKVDAKIPVDEAKLAKQNELKRVEADILGKEQSIPAKRQELLTLNEQKRTLEANLATITELINEKEQAGENTEILQAQKRQYESDIATKSSQITALERDINQLNSDIEVLNQTKERLKREEALIQSPELATKDFVNELKNTLTSSINTKANANATVNLTGNQTVAGVKTFSSPVVVPNATANTHAVNLAQLNTKANQATTYTKTEVDTRVNAKANANATVNLTGNQTIAGNKTLSGTTTLAATVINGATQLKGAVTATGAITSSGNVTFNTGQVTFNNKAPISTVAPTAANHLATKAYIDGINATLTGSINTKANANAVVTLTGNQTVAGVKTFSSPIVVPNATANTHAVNLAQLNTKANQATTYTKTEVDTRVNAKANANAVVALTGNQTIAGIKTFSAVPISATNPTANNQVANKAYVDTVVNAKANANATVNLTGNQTIAGIKTFSAVPVCSILPTADTQLANRNYVKKRGGYVAVTGGAIDLNKGINFSLNLTAATNITVANAAANIGQTGEIFIAKGANIQAFSAPFNFRIAQSGFGNNEVFSYVVVSKSLVRIVRS
ncbi:hypothetical protein [Campylobacter devanensis]|uniref:hypothetical protein n=1 Tax=Campylobacter devanensis TaxID=3161138 RepID=UPI000A338E2E|nr:hypothetical protein [Campylobacter sp. P0106]